MRVREMWRNIHAKFTQNKRYYSSTRPSSDSGGGGGSGAQGGDGGENIAYTTTAYLMA